MSVTPIAELRPALVMWERLRVWYNGVMLGTGLFLSYGIRDDMQEQAELGYWGNVALYGLVANVFFSLGPLLESYWVAFRGKGFARGTRRFLFALGLGFSLVVTLMLCVSVSLLYFHM